jgi:hypothetical protein
MVAQRDPAPCVGAPRQRLLRPDATDSGFRENSHIPPRNAVDPVFMDSTLIATLAAIAGLILLVLGVQLAGRASVAADALGARSPAGSPGRGSAHRQAHPHLRRPVSRQTRAHAFELS